MNQNNKNVKYGTPVDASEIFKRKKRLPEYDDCLTKFLESEDKAWEVNLDVLPSKKPRIVLSSLKWRTKKSKFKGIQVIMKKKKIYLKRVEEDEK